VLNSGLDPGQKKLIICVSAYGASILLQAYDVSCLAEFLFSRDGRIFDDARVG
jgi:hypothetical protein